MGTRAYEREMENLQTRDTAVIQIIKPSNNSKKREIAGNLQPQTPQRNAIFLQKISLKFQH